MNLTSSTSPLRCPVCGELLDPAGRTFHCVNNHTFDSAKEGYINLLLSHQRRSNTPGDDKAMVQARRRFFDSGVYTPLINRVANLAGGLPCSSVLDCGCGEGHLSGGLCREGTTVFGVDISKEAVRLAATRYKQAHWIVANAMRSLPFADRSMNIILSILAPRNPAEFARMLNPDGVLILGVPGPNHLIELRSQLQADAGGFDEKADAAAAQCAPHFMEVQRELLNYRCTLNPAQIADLIQMTPLFWNSSPEAREKVCRLDELDITVSFVLLQLAPE
jgi:23S rRNA (guanine745-N1)-methyltransferase